MSGLVDRLVSASAAAALAATLLVCGAPLAKADEDVWPTLKETNFGDRDIKAEDGFVTLDAPVTAEDAAIVPLTVRVPPSVKDKLKSLTLIIDKNPNPVVAKVQLRPRRRHWRRALVCDARPHRQFLSCPRHPRDRGRHPAHGDQIRAGRGRLRGDAGQGPRRRHGRSRQDDREDLPAGVVVDAPVRGPGDDQAPELERHAARHQYRRPTSRRGSSRRWW